MKLAFVTLLTLAGVAIPTASESFAASPAAYCEECNEGDSCSQCRGGKLAGGAAEMNAKNNLRYMMPQTCYSPRHGCYSSNERHMHRYPAFHGTYYRQAYNYRNLFDYPWHADLHEPTSHFSYNVGGESAGPAAAPVPAAARNVPKFQPPVAQQQPVSANRTASQIPAFINRPVSSSRGMIKPAEHNPIAANRQLND